MKLLMIVNLWLTKDKPKFFILYDWSDLRKIGMNGIFFTFFNFCFILKGE